MAGPIFLHEAEHGAADHHGQHDDGVGPLPDERRNRGGEDQDENERALELVQEQPQRRGPPPLAQGVQPVAAQAALGFLLVEPCAAGLQFCQ